MKYTNSTGTSLLNKTAEELTQVRFIADQFFDRTTLERGLAYAEAGCASVGGINAGLDTLQILGTCRGTFKAEYRQDVRLGLADGVVKRVSGSCSCPVGHNCKHVVALLQTWRSPAQPFHAGGASGHAGRH